MVPSVFSFSITLRHTHMMASHAQHYKGIHMFNCYYLYAQFVVRGGYRNLERGGSG